MTDPYKDIFEFIKTQENAYKQPIQLPGGWSWNMQEHVETSYLYINSQLTTGKDDFKPVKNIIRPILNVQHRTEDIEVKDVELYVDDPEKYHLSFLVKKYHDDVFVVENDLDTFFDELNVSRIDYGGGLSKQLDKPCPEIVELQSIVFCDQTDILSGPIGIKHFYSPDQLKDMESKGWGNEANGATGTIDDAIRFAREQKKEGQNNTLNNTPGRYIEVYEVHGNFPKRFLNDADQSGLFSRQLHIVTMYQKADGSKGYIILYQAEEAESPFKLIKRDPVYGRALGFGGAEELFDAQVWTNYDMIRAQDMLDAAAKTIMITSDPELALKHPNGLKDIDNMEFLEEALNSNTRQLDTFPRNLRLFEDSMAKWEEHAKTMGAANDPIQGVESASGVPFAALQAQIQQGLGLHQYRRGQYAKHLEEIYQDWIIPHIERKITQGMTFLSELSLEDMQFVTDGVVTSQMNQFKKDAVFSGQFDNLTPDILQAYEQQIRQEFAKGGNKRFVEILKGEFKGVSLGVKVSIAGKSKDLSQMTDKLVNVFRTVIAAPQMLQIPSIAKLFNEILEASGLEKIDFSHDAGKMQELMQPPQQPGQPQPAQPQGQPQPVAA